MSLMSRLLFSGSKAERFQCVKRLELHDSALAHQPEQASAGYATNRRPMTSLRLDHLLARLSVGRGQLLGAILATTYALFSLPP